VKAHALAARPVLPPDVPQYFLPVTSTGTPRYAPVLLGAAKLHFLDEKQKLDETQDAIWLAPLNEAAATVDWSQAKAADLSLDELEKEPVEGAQFENLPEAAAKAKNYAAWTKTFATWLFQSQKLNLFESPSLGERSAAGEPERDFRIRLQQKAREERDRQAEALRQKYAPKIAALEERKRRAELATEQQKAQRSQAMLQTAVSVGAGLLGAFLGRKVISTTTVTRAATAARQAGRSWKETQDVSQAAENVEQLTQQAAELERQFQAELADQQGKVDPTTEQFETVSVRLKKTNIEVQLVALAWTCRPAA
jgi:DNA-binding ferritin-like protein